MSQLLLFGNRKRFENWKQFHRDNRIIFRLFYRFAYQALDSGRKRFSARMIGERIRWYTAVETSDPDYKINDHHWPYYARLMAGLDDRFEDFFVFKNERFDSTVDEILAYHSQLPKDPLGGAA